MADDTRKYEDFDRLSGAEEGGGLDDAYARAGNEIADSTGLGKHDPDEARPAGEGAETDR
jgi:hypothetical protein